MRSPAGQVVALLFLMLGVAVGVGAADSTADCKTAISGMTSCLPYASAKSTSPTSDCCTAVNNTVQNNGDCLCHFIAMVHQGSPQVNSLGVQEARLKQLPSACNLKHVNASNCSQLAPSSSPSSSNDTSATIGYMLHDTLRLEALFLVALIAFLLPTPNGLLLDVFRTRN